MHFKDIAYIRCSIDGVLYNNVDGEPKRMLCGRKSRASLKQKKKP